MEMHKEAGMERYKVLEQDDHQIIFSSIKEMEQAYQQLADGKDIIIFTEDGAQRAGEILSGKVFARIMDGAFKLTCREKI
jgi:hypothetical protein